MGRLRPCNWPLSPYRGFLHTKDLLVTNIVEPLFFFRSLCFTPIVSYINRVNAEEMNTFLYYLVSEIDKA